MMEKFLQVWGILGPIGSWFVSQVYTKRALKNSSDTKNYTDLSNKLPTQREIQSWFGGQDFKSPFLTDTFHSFYGSLNDQITNPAAKFHSKKLNMLVSDIVEKCSEMNELIGLQTFPHANGGQTIRRVKYSFNVDDYATADKLCKTAEDILARYVKFQEIAKDQLIL